MARLPRLRRPTGWYDGPLCYCSDPELVPFRGFYATKVNRKGHEVPDPKRPLVPVIENGEHKGYRHRG